MAMKLQEAIGLSEKLASDLTAHRGTWQNYLLTAARVYKYSFHEQLMIYGQRPNATACAEIELWNDRMGRRVNRGTCGIALIDLSSRKPRVRYVFDVADTHLTQERNARTPRLWSISPEQHEAVSAALEDMFPSAEIAGLPFDEKIIKICKLAVQNQLVVYFTELKRVRENSLLEELDELNLGVRFQRLLENSVAYTVLTRCGIDASEYYDDDDFEEIFDFSTSAVISVLGSATSDISRVLLLELGKLANSVGRGQRQRPGAKPSAAVQPVSEPTPMKAEHMEHTGDPAPTAQPNIASEAEAEEASAFAVSEGETQASGLQKSVHDFYACSGIDYYYQDDEKNELLRISDALKDHKPQIAAFFAAHTDSKERGDFVKSFFDNTYVEKILSNGQRAGYRAWDDMLTLWRGPYLSRECEVFMRWTKVASIIYGMILLDQWLDPEKKPEGQLSFMDAPTTDKSSKFTLPQDAIDYILCGGSDMSQGKFRIYEQYQKQQTNAENAVFLKQEYGIGGHSDAIPGSGYWEDHDGKGITITRDYSDPNSKFLLTWNKVAKRIGELIAGDRYLNQAEKAQYLIFLKEKEDRNTRQTVAREFKSIVAEYNTLQEQSDHQAAKLDAYLLNDCADQFGCGEKKTWTQLNDRFILPLMREAMQTIIAEAAPLAERCETMLTELNGPLAAPLEPTYEELDPPLEPEREYRFSLGDTVYVGTKRYEMLAYSDESVTLYDPEFPLFQEVMPRSEFDAKIAESPLNDHLLVAVEDTAEKRLENTQELEDVSGINTPKHTEREPQETAQEPAIQALVPPAQREHSRISPTTLYPEIPAGQRHDYKITDLNLGTGTPGERFSNNVRAIRLLKRLEEESRLALPEEQEVLAKYVGWGGLADCFDERHSKYAELKALLTEDEYASARASTLNAHYTTPVVIQAIYTAIGSMGFTKGNILDKTMPRLLQSHTI